MEYYVACLDRRHFLKSNEIVRLSRSLISLFDTRVDNRVKFNITRLKSWWQLLLVQVAFWDISDYHESTRGKCKQAARPSKRRILPVGILVAFVVRALSRGHEMDRK